MMQFVFSLLITAVAPPARLVPVAAPTPHYARMIADIAPLPEGGSIRDHLPRWTPLGVDSFPSPDTAPFGLEWIGDKLWNCDLRAQMVYQLDPDDGSVLREFSSPDAWSKDLAFDGTYLDVCGNSQSRIYRLDTTSGSVVSSFPAPGSNPVGLAWDGTYLWNADWNADQSQPSYIYKLNPANGQVIGSILTPAQEPAGLAWDGSHLWNVDMKNRVIYELDPTSGAILRAIGTPGANPTGLALDGNEVWNCDWAGAMIYHFELDSAPPVLAINSPSNYDALPCWRNVAVIGTIWGPDLLHYTVEYAAGETPGTWSPIGAPRTDPVYLDTLAGWDVSGIVEAGVYWLRLNAVFAGHTDTTRQVKLNLDPQIMTGWPQTFANVSPVGVANADDAGNDEIFAGLNHQDYFNQRLGAWHVDGSALGGFPVAGINNCQMAPAFARLPGSQLQAAVTGYDLNNTQVYVTEPNGSIRPGWPKDGGHSGTHNYLGLPAVGAVNRDTLPEIFTGGSSLSGWRLNGAALSGFPVAAELSSPAIADLNGDGARELIALSASRLEVFDSAGTAVPPFPKAYSGTAVEQYPVVGDINNDQRYEIVFCLGAQLYAVNDTGAVLSGFPKALSGSYANSPGLGDIDRDGAPEIIVVSGTFPSYTAIAAFHGDGTPVSGFPKQFNGRVFRAFNEPVLADIDGDTFPEIVMGFEGVAEDFEELHALRHDGSEEPGWPKRLRYIDGYGITGSPVIGDFDNDGEVEMAVSSNAYWVFNTDIYVWDLHQPLIAAAMPWPTQRHDNQRTACLGNVLTGVTEPGSPSAKAGLGFSASPNPFREKAVLRLPSDAGRAPARVVIYDASGRLVRSLLVPAPAAGGSVSWDGADGRGSRLSPGVYFVRLCVGDRLLGTRLVLQ